jgi:integrase
MSKEATGELRKSSTGAFSALIRTWEKRETFLLPTCTDEDAAKERMHLLADVAKRFRLANVNRARGDEALRSLAAISPKFLKGAIEVCEDLLGGKIPVKSGPTVPTFKELAEEWTGGKLQKRFPDHVGKGTEDYNDGNAQRFEKAIYPVIGHIRLDELAREECDDVMRKLPEGLSKATRRQYAGLINRVLNLAELAGHIQRNPLPRGWLPKLGAKKRFPVLYASEDRAVLECVGTEDVPGIPLAFRILYAVLHREGMRRGEAAALEWRDIDLEHGTISLDENKTDHPRFWKLAPGVTETLAAWHAHRGEPEDDEHVFTDEHGRPLSLDHLADRVRADLKRAGLTRADLFSKGPNKGQFGTHCFRRSFVTRSLALGKNEDWVRQRTGHKSEELLTYRQGAKALAELDPAELEPLTPAALGLPSDCHTDTSRRWRNWQTRQIQVRPESADSPQDRESANDEIDAVATRPAPSGTGVAETATPRERMIANLNADLGAALADNDLEAAKIAHEAIGRLLGSGEKAAPVADLAAERKRRER